MDGIVILYGIIVIAIIIGTIINYIIICKKIKKNEKLDKKQRNKKYRKSTFGMLLWIIISVIVFLEILIEDIQSCTAYKPLIYLYPECEQIVNVKLGKKENLTCTYPKYKDDWKVKAYPNGDLVDLETNRNLYGLYWEGKITNKTDFKEGFCIKGSDTIVFLEEKLKVLGLTEREANEFIIYWLPKLEKNKYNLIRFETMEEINENMPLEITPKPDTLIRIIMEYKPIKKYVNIQEQELNTPERNGFVAVEWGGTEVK